MADTKTITFTQAQEALSKFERDVLLNKALVQFELFPNNITLMHILDRDTKEITNLLIKGDIEFISKTSLEERQTTENLKGFTKKTYDSSMLSNLIDEPIGIDTVEISKKLITERNKGLWLSPWEKELRDMVYEDIIVPAIEKHKKELKEWEIELGACKNLFGNCQKYEEELNGSN